MPVSSEPRWDARGFKGNQDAIGLGNAVSGDPREGAMYNDIHSGDRALLVFFPTKVKVR